MPEAGCCSGLCYCLYSDDKEQTSEPRESLKMVKVLQHLNQFFDRVTYKGAGMKAVNTRNTQQ